MDQNEYFAQLRGMVHTVFEAHHHQNNHLNRFPWLIGALGDPFAGVWFVAENPSLTMVERAVNPDGGPATPEAQWYASKGDQLFRMMLVKHGFKSGEWNSLGDWHCYITDVIKEADYAEVWRAKSRKAQDEVALKWADVLRWELQTSRPRLIVAMGQTVLRLLQHLRQARSLPFPQIEVIPHYSYIAYRARGKQGPMHPQRVKEYDEDFARLASQFREMDRG